MLEIRCLELSPHRPTKIDYQKFMHKHVAL